MVTPEGLQMLEDRAPRPGRRRSPGAPRGGRGGVASFRAHGTRRSWSHSTGVAGVIDRRRQSKRPVDDHRARSPGCTVSFVGPRQIVGLRGPRSDLVEARLAGEGQGTGVAQQLGRVEEVALFRIPADRAPGSRSGHPVRGRAHGSPMGRRRLVTVAGVPRRRRRRGRVRPPRRDPRPIESARRRPRSTPPEVVCRRS